MGGTQYPFWMMGSVPHRFGVKFGQGPNQRLVCKAVDK